jgi:type I restriction enzyme S subunit
MRDRTRRRSNTQKRQSNERESGTLAALRDTLLPKLISGEFRLKNAEQFTYEVI